eukprot:1194858-Amphidinium_carterae.1
MPSYPSKRCEKCNDMEGSGTATLPKFESSMVAGGGPASKFPPPSNIACLCASPRWMRKRMSFVTVAASERMSKASRLLFAMQVPTVTVAKACAMSAGLVTLGSKLSL